MFRTIDAALADVENRFQKAFDRSAQPVRRELKRALDRVVEDMRRQHSTPWRPGGSQPRRLYKRSGAGLRGIARSVKVQQRGGAGFNEISGQVGAPFPISVHEKGAVVRAKRARFLTIPLPAALDARGVPRRQRARDWPNTFIQTSRRGNLIIFQKTAGGIRPLYLLRTQTSFPARLGLGKAFQKQLGVFEGRLIDQLDRALAAA